jgi:hypothetical protein
LVVADVEEGTAIAKAFLEVGEVVADAVEGVEPLDKAGGTFSPRVDGDPGRNITPVAATRCPMVGTNCRGILRTVAMGMA